MKLVLIALAIIAAAATAGCLEPNLTPCGDLECAPGAMCLPDRQVCAFPDALAACAGQADGTLCQTRGIDGACDAGLCVASVCGDGKTTGREQCDGATTSATCADFRFYYGDLACTSSCLIDTSGCSGSCGDGLVQSDQGELCDGGPPPRACTELGHDFGHVECTAQCTDTSTKDCGNYLGTLVFAASGSGNSDPINDVWVAQDLIVVSRISGLVVIDRGIRTEFAGTFSRIAASGNTIVVGDGAGVDQVVHGALVPEPDLGAGGASVVAVDFAPTGEQWALTADCQVRTFVNGAWRVQPALPESGCKQLMFDATGNVFACTSNDVRWFDGTGWTNVPGPSNINALNQGMGGHVIVVTDGGGFELVQSVAKPTPITAFAFDAVAIGDAYLGTSLYAVRFGVGDYVSFPSITDLPSNVRRFPDGSVVMWHYSVYRLDALTAADVAPHPSILGAIRGTPFGFVFWDPTGVYALDGPSVGVSVGTIYDVAVSDNTVYAATTGGVTQGTFGGTWTTDVAALGYTIWADPAGDTALITTTNTVTVRAAGAPFFTALPAHGCAGTGATSLAGPSLTELYVARACADNTAIIDQWDGSTWTTVQTIANPVPGNMEIFSPAVTLVDGSVAFGGSELLVGRGTSWTVIHTGGTSPTGTSVTDVWFAGVQNGPGIQGVAHWNGTDLAAVRSIDGSPVYGIAADADTAFVITPDHWRLLARWAVP